VTAPPAAHGTVDGVTTSPPPAALRTARGYTWYAGPILRWHSDARCATGVTFAFNPPKTLVAPTLADLAAAQTVLDRSPCVRCAMAAVLDELAATDHPGGYHVVTCSNWHDVGGDCLICDELTEYAAARPGTATASVTGDEARVAVLQRGDLGRPVEEIFGGLLKGASVAGATLPQSVTAAAWPAAAQLADGRTSLGQVLAAVAALGATPAATHTL